MDQFRPDSFRPYIDFNNSTGRFFAYNFRVGNLVESLFESTWFDGVIILVELELELELDFYVN